MRFCDECGAELEDTAVFCDNCGTKVEGTITVSGDGEENHTVHTKNKSLSAILKIVVAVVIICIIVIIIAVVIGRQNKKTHIKDETTKDDIATSEQAVTEETTEEATTEETTTEVNTTEEVATEEVTTEEVTAEPPTPEAYGEYLQLIESIDGEYLSYDDYIGEWFDEYSGRCYMEITSENEMLYVYMRWGSSYNSTTIWEMNCYYDENTGCIAYTLGRQIFRTYLETGDFYDEVLYTDGTGVFYYKDGAIRWLDKKENKGEYSLFLPMESS